MEIKLYHTTNFSKYVKFTLKLYDVFLYHTYPFMIADKPLGCGTNEQRRIVARGLEARAPARARTDGGGALVVRGAQARP